MCYHPAIYTLITVVILLIFRKSTKIFTALSILLPIFALPGLYLAEGTYIIKILSRNLIINFHSADKLIALAFLVITLAANLYTSGRGRQIEIITGGFYLSFALICLFAGDFISMFIALELMVIAATILIFVGNTVPLNRLLSRQYLLTHLFSGGLILVGISYITFKFNLQEISLLTTKMTDTQALASFSCYLLLTGFLINVAVFPCSNWLVNCYQGATNSGFMYLISFTTKVSMVILCKLFSGLALLKFFGIAMMLYGGVYGCLASNIKRSFMFLAIYQLGFMLIATSIGTGVATPPLNIYLVIHIIYQALLVTCVAILQDNCHISDYLALTAIKNRLLTVSLATSLFMMLNFPLSATFISKLLITSNLSDHVSYYVVQGSIVLLCLVIPVKQLLRGKSLTVNLDKYQTCSLVILLVALLGLQIVVIKHSPALKYSNIFLLNNSIKQLIIIMLGILLSMLVPVNTFKISLKVVDFDLLVVVSNIIKYLYKTCFRRLEDKLPTAAQQNIIAATGKVAGKIATKTGVKLYAVHNQSAAIALVFSLLVILLLV